MIESIGSVNNDLSVLINNLVKKTEVKNVQVEDIKDEHLPATEPEKYQTYNKKGSIEKDHVVLPDRYSQTSLGDCYMYYKGERVSQLDILQIAVDTGAIELNEQESVFSNYDRAWEALVESKAKPLYSWSSSLYSEDGMYKFRVENGEITGMTLARNSDGVLYTDMVKDLASGIRPCDLGYDFIGLAHLDPELYQAACQIGSAKRMYDEAEDKSLFQILFGFNVQNNEKDFVTMALENYNKNRYNNWFLK